MFQNVLFKMLKLVLCTWEGFFPVNKNYANVGGKKSTLPVFYVK